MQQLVSFFTAQAGMVFRYLLVGLFSIGIQVVILFVWVDLLMLEDLYLVGSVVGFTVSVVIAFFLQKYWTFKDTSKETSGRQFLLYAGIACFNLLLNLALLAAARESFHLLGLDFFGGWYLLAQIGILGICAVISFLANRFLTFSAVAR